MNYIITEEELASLEKTGNPSYKKSVDYVIGRIRSRPVMPRQVIPDELLTELANELSTYDDGVKYCDICDHCINPDKFDLRDHTKECLLHRIATSLTAQAEGGEKEITLRDIIKQSRENNKRHDWGKLSAIESLMLVVGECSEAIVCIRDDDNGLHYREDGKPLGLISELADIIIRTCSLTGIEVPEETMIEAVKNKLLYNFSRSKNHGRKI